MFFPGLHIPAPHGSLVDQEAEGGLNLQTIVRELEEALDQQKQGMEAQERELRERAQRLRAEAAYRV